MPVPLESDSRVRNVVVRVVEDLPYGFIFGADYVRRNRSTLELAPDKGFRPVFSAPWVSFYTAALDTSPHPNPLRTERDRFRMLTPPPQTPFPLPPAPVALPTVRPSYHDIAWEDESTSEWDMRQVAATTTFTGFTQHRGGDCSSRPPTARSTACANATYRTVRSREGSTSRGRSSSVVVVVGVSGVLQSSEPH